MKLFKIFKSATLAVALVGLVGLNSCNYLDVVPPEQPNIDDSMKTYDRARGFLYSCYKGIYNGDLTLNHRKEVNSTTDEYFNPYTWNSDVPQLNGTLRNTMSPADLSSIDWEWGSWYKYVGQCLLFEQKLADVGSKQQWYQDMSDTELKTWLAESRFLKAFYHYLTLRRYGPIPITTELIPMTTPESQFKGRYHYDYCVAYLAKEFDECAKDLPAVRPENEIGRATSTICKAIKGRMLLYAASPLWNGKFPYPTWRNENFTTPADEELGTPDYGLDLVSHTYDASKWQKALDANLEALQLAIGAGQRELFCDTTMYHQNGLDLPYIPFDAPEGFAQKVMMLRYLNTTRENEGNREIIFASSEGISGYTISARLPYHILVKQDGTQFDTWNGLGASLYTIEHFNTVDGYLPENDPNYFEKDEWYTAAGLRGSRAEIVKICTNREPRFYAWMSFHGGDYGSRLYDNKRPLTLNMRKSNAQGYAPREFTRNFCPSGFLPQKWLHPAAYFTISGQQNWYNTAPYPIIRLAEVYLNIAECYAELGQTANALQYLNPIRNRAGVPDLTETMVAQSGMSIVDWVRNERFIELWNESQRFFDIRRWKLGQQQLGYGTRMVLNCQVENPSFEEFFTPMPLNFPYTWGDRLYVYPVFYNECNKNPQLVQAPGY